MHIPLRLAALTAPLLLAPGAAFAQSPLNVVGVFGDSTPVIKLLMLGLGAASLVAVIATGLKLLPGRRLAGGSSLVSSLRLGGPLIGLLGAAYTLLMIFIGIANVGGEPPLSVLSPGFAEAAMVLLLGLLTGVIAVICQGVIEARIDRTVLSS